jgi:hypothetical protein
VTETAAATPAHPAETSLRLVLRGLGWRTWVRAGVASIGTGLVVAIPTRVVPNDWFSRMTPVRPLDYVFLAVSSALIGMVLALRRAGGPADSAAAGSGLATVFAVGCPVCNKLVVALLGAGGATAWFAPIQPLLGVGAMAIAALALRAQLRSSPLSCPVPPAKT